MEQLRRLSSHILEYLTNCSDLTEALHATPTEAERTIIIDPLEAELAVNPLDMGLTTFLLAHSDMYQLNAEAKPSGKCPRLEYEHNQQYATNRARNIVD